MAVYAAGPVSQENDNRLFIDEGTIKIALAVLAHIGLGLGIAFAIPSSRGDLLHFFGKVVPHKTRRFIARRSSAFYILSMAILGIGLVALSQIKVVTDSEESERQETT